MEKKNIYAFTDSKQKIRGLVYISAIIKRIKLGNDIMNSVHLFERYNCWPVVGGNNVLVPKCAWHWSLCLEDEKEICKQL